MRKIAIIIFSIAIYSCTQQENSPQIQLYGWFSGYCELENNTYWCSIAFMEGLYEEWPSGGAYTQKSLGGLSAGQYYIDGDRLIFELDSFKFVGFPEPCKQIMLLPDTYDITHYTKNDSIVFQKHLDTESIVYYLKIQNSNEYNMFYIHRNTFSFF